MIISVITIIKNKIIPEITKIIIILMTNNKDIITINKIIIEIKMNKIMMKV